MELTIKSKTFGDQVVMIDDIDFELVSKYKWFIYKSPIGERHMYAVCRIPGFKHYQRMHRLIMGVIGSRKIIDHKDRNGLNNQRSNLRIATNSQNLLNKPANCDNKIGYKGVHWNQNDKRFAVFVTVSGRSKFGGNYKTAIDAAKRYNELARQYHGEFAYQNPV